MPAFSNVELFSSSDETSADKRRLELRVEDDRLYWGSDERSFDYLSIVLHAISRKSSNDDNDDEEDATDDRRPCIYLQVQLDRNSEGDGGDDDDVEEIRLVPEFETDVDAIFAALSRCAALHLDPTSDDDNEEEEEGAGAVFGQFDDAV